MTIERVSGECRVMFAFEAGYAVDLARAESRLPAAAREALPQSRRLPADSDFTQKPLRFAVEHAAIEIDGFRSASLVEATIYDFGAISVSFRIPFDAAIEALAALAAALWNNRTLAAEEVADAVQHPISYGPHDLVLVDWAAALVVDAEPAATLAVLEHANVQLVELKHLDTELDRGLDQVWAMLNERALFARFRLRANLRRLAELELEGAALFDSVVNALKLFGDQHLARVQRSATRRFRIDDWEQSVSRKLATLSSISERLESRQSQYRSELLEWIIIALILFEIIQAFW